MNYSAVIFDLFGTLVPDILGPEYRRIAEKMAAVLSVPPDSFSEMWFGTGYERNIGRFETIQDNIRFICTHLNRNVDEDQVLRATDIRYEFVRRTMMSPRQYLLETLAELRKMKIRIALLSDCSSSEEEIWPDTPFNTLFDATVFSSSVKLKKPDPRIFNLAADRLQIGISECIYVGNGGSNEIEGSFNSGMFPVLILPEDNAPVDNHPDKETVDFAREHGRVIDNHKELLELLI